MSTMSRFLEVTLVFIVLVGLAYSAPDRHIWGNAGTKLQPSNEEEISKLDEIGKPFTDFCIGSRDRIIEVIRTFNHPIIFETYEELFEMADGSVDKTTGKTHYETIRELLALDQEDRLQKFNAIMKRSEYKEIFGDLFIVCDKVPEYYQLTMNMFADKRSSLGAEDMNLEDVKCKTSGRMLKIRELCVASVLKNRYFEILDENLIQDLKL